MRSSFEIIDFFDIRVKSFEEYKIFKKNSLKKMRKSIFPNLMGSALFGYNKDYEKQHTFSVSIYEMFTYENDSLNPINVKNFFSGTMKSAD